MADRRPNCIMCGDRIDRLQRSPGVMVAYPCGCWLTFEQAEAIKALVRELADAEGVEDVLDPGLP